MKRITVNYATIHINLKGYEFIMEFPDKDGNWEKYLCSYDVNVGDKCFPNMSDIETKWREEDCLFDINDPHICKSFSYDDVWKESQMQTSHGYGKKSNYFKIVRKI